MVLGLGGLLALAFAISIARPELALWAYGAAALIGLVPITRRAYAGAVSGTPFSIETLMTVAAAGAIAIGAAEEAAVVIFLFAVRRASGNSRSGARQGGHQSSDQSHSAHRPDRRGRPASGGAR